MTEQLQSVLGIAVPNSLLTSALTHSSFAGEHPDVSDNERLEFLGDAVIELAYREYLYVTYPHMSEGELAVLRSAAVREASLAQRARLLNLGAYLRLGRGEERNGGRDRDSILADTFEAIVGAIYLGCGWDTARLFVIGQLAGTIDQPGKDYKTRLQELLQARSARPPVYRVMHESGPDHDKVYTVEVLHQNAVLGRGSGGSKKRAEQRAAKRALQRIEEGSEAD